MAIRTLFRSVRFRLALMSSAVVFGTGALALGAIYLVLRRYLQADTMTRLRVEGSAIRIGEQVFVIPRQVTPEQVQSVEAIYRQLVLNRVTLTTLVVLSVLFVISLVMGWLSAGRVLRPIGEMTRVAREIQARDLGRRIDVDDPDNELGQLAATFNGMLDRLERAFGQQRTFLAQTSHDLRTPLAVMRSNLEVTMADPDADLEEWRRTAEVVARAGERMSEMVDALLAAARFEAGAEQATEIDLVEVVAVLAEEARARIPVDFEAGPPMMVKGNAIGLARAVSNLMENAINAGGGDLKLAVGREGEWVFAAVADRGPGFDPDLLRSGPGLGLAIARRVAESHGGHLMMVPRVGGGSVVVVFLPPIADEPLLDPIPIRLAEI
jgi:signal transduction histidine kinase